MPVKILVTSLLLITLGPLSACEVLSCSNTPKIDGVSWVGRPNPVTTGNIAAVKQVNAGWLALIPYGFSKTGSTDLRYNQSWQWWGETPEGISKTTQLAKQQGLHVMIKPQVWLQGGTYVGHLTYETEAEWQGWEASYSDFILFFAELAEEVDADMFCIGTEWTAFFKARPNYWQQLIKEVRQVYNGPITYAANWDAYEAVPFWDQLDYIGVDAYFPVANKPDASVAHLVSGWQQHVVVMEALAAKHCKPILFTEFGYRSVSDCATKPWEHAGGEQSLTAQQNALEALFQRFWTESWFAGGFLWNWYPDHEGAGGDTCTDFTPQNKPAAEIVSNWYRTY